MTKKEILHSAPVYFQRYIKEVVGDDIAEALLREGRKGVEFYQNIPEAKHHYRYQDRKWHVKEILSHVIETERVMSTRALAFSREDGNRYPGFNQDQYVIHGLAEKRSMDSLIEEFDHLRNANVLMFAAMDNVMLERVGRWDTNEASVETIAYIIAGHELHHRKIISDRVLELL